MVTRHYDHYMSEVGLKNTQFALLSHIVKLGPSAVELVDRTMVELALTQLSEKDVERHRSILGGLGLPLTYRSDRWEMLLATMQRDKKSRGGSLRFVVLDGIGKPGILNAPTPELLFTAFQAIVE